MDSIETIRIVNNFCRQLQNSISEYPASREFSLVEIMEWIKDQQLSCIATVVENSQDVEAKGSYVRSDGQHIIN